MSDPHLRDEAMEALLGLGWRPTQQHHIEAASEKEARICAEQSRYSECLRHGAVGRKVLLEFIRRQRSVYGATEIAALLGPEAAPYLIPQLLQRYTENAQKTVNYDGGLAESYVSGLHSLGYQSIIPFLQEAINVSSTRGFQRTFLWVKHLAEVMRECAPPPEIVAEIAELLSRSPESVRTFIIEVVGDTEDRRYTDMLINIVSKDRAESVRKAAMRTLAKVVTAEDICTVISRLGNSCSPIDFLGDILSLSRGKVLNKVAAVPALVQCAQVMPASPIAHSIKELLESVLRSHASEVPDSQLRIMSRMPNLHRRAESTTWNIDADTLEEQHFNYAVDCENVRALARTEMLKRGLV
jgi:hypothetical protein